MASPKPALTIVVYRKQTRVRRAERWGIRIMAANHEPLFSSEKYHNHVDARHAADLLANGKLTVLDEADVLA